MPRYFVLYKPFGVLSQFTREAPDHQTLADVYDFPEKVYPVGRLDKDSEGLLLLTDDKSLNFSILHPSKKHEKCYLVQVEGVPDLAAVEHLRAGVAIRIHKKWHQTLPAQVELLNEPPDLPERIPAVRFRKKIPTAWLKISVIEGKNRQLRRMCATVGYPTLRLVRWSVGTISIEGFASGEVKEVSKEKVYGFVFKNKL